MYLSFSSCVLGFTFLGPALARHRFPAFGDDHGSSVYYEFGLKQNTGAAVTDNGPGQPVTEREGLSHIVNATTTFQVPAAPETNDAVFAMYPGLQNTFGDLVQSVISYFSKDTMVDQSPCGDEEGYCVFCNFYKQPAANTADNATQYTTRGKIVQPGDILEITYQWDQTTGNYTQTISRNNEALASLSTNPSSKIYKWSPKTECVYNGINNIPAHNYRGTKIVISDPYPMFGDVGTAHVGANGAPYSPDKGTTWIVDLISVESFNCQPNVVSTPVTQINIPDTAGNLANLPW